MFYLTDNKIEFEGRIFVQVKKPLPNGSFKYGGYIEQKLPIIRGDVWIEENSYVFGDCEINGKVRRELVDYIETSYVSKISESKGF